MNIAPNNNTTQSKPTGIRATKDEYFASRMMPRYTLDKLSQIFNGGIAPTLYCTKNFKR